MTTSSIERCADVLRRHLQRRLLRSDRAEGRPAGTGIVGAGRVVAESAGPGPVGAVRLLSLALTIFIGLINLLPLVPLDGGHLTVIGVEAITRKPVDMRRLIPLAAAVLAFFVILSVVFLYYDIFQPIRTRRFSKRRRGLGPLAKGKKSLQQLRSLGRREARGEDPVHTAGQGRRAFDRPWNDRSLQAGSPKTRTYTVQLLVTELVTNSLRHARVRDGRRDRHPDRGREQAHARVRVRSGRVRGAEAAGAGPREQPGAGGCSSSMRWPTAGASDTNARTCVWFELMAESA